MRLIDADEIKKREHDVVLVNGAKHRCFDTTMLFEIPTVDAVEVVRCKDCIHWYREYGENKCLEFADIPLEPNDFWSHGERRKDADN